MTRCLLALLAAAPALALTPPNLYTVERAPSGLDFPNIVYTLENVSTNAQGKLVVSVAFSAEPQSEPSLTLCLSMRDPATGGVKTTLSPAEGSTWALSASPDAPGPFVYDFTFPALPEDIPLARTAVVRRGRFGLPDGGFEGGGYAIVDSVTRAVYVGRSGRFTIGGEEIVFDGGVAVSKAAKQAEESEEEGQTVARMRSATRQRPTIAGRPLAFPLLKPPQEAEP